MNNTIERTIDPPLTMKMLDYELIEQARQDPRAFGKVYERYVQSIYHYVFNRTGNAADAEDITSQIFLAALEGIRKYREYGFFAAWLFAIARRKVVDHYRSHRNHIDLDEVPFTILIEDNLDEHLILDQRRAALGQLIQALPERDKELLRLRYLAELNFADIARLLKHSEPAIKKSFYRLIARIQNQLEVSNE